MAGNKAGGAKAAATNKSKFGKDYYARIGALGGAAGNTGGFYANRELARTAGAKGGSISKRGPSKKKAHTDFQSGFNQPTWRQRLIQRFGARNAS